MTTVAIMQPTYLPWLGYFDMLDQADVFVLLDTVPVSPKSWQTRNRIRARDGNVVWLSVPTNARRGMMLSEVETAHNRVWQARHWRTLESAYGHAPYWGIVMRPWALVHQRLADLTCYLIEDTAIRLDIDTPIVRASSLGEHISPHPIARIADLCNATGATELLNTPGAQEFLDGQDVGVPIRWHAYEHPVYDQGGAPFVSHLSVVDLIAWHGPDSLAVIRSGRV